MTQISGPFLRAGPLGRRVRDLVSALNGDAPQLHRPVGHAILASETAKEHALAHAFREPPVGARRQPPRAFPLPSHRPNRAPARSRPDRGRPLQRRVRLAPTEALPAKARRMKVAPRGFALVLPADGGFLLS